MFMNQASAQRKQRSAATRNVKTLITVASVAATVGGWAALSVADGASSASAAPAPQAIAPQTNAPNTDQNPFTQQPSRRNGRRSFSGSGAPSTGLLPGFGGSSDGQTPSLGGSSSGQLPAPLGRTRSSR
jgi:hypothetical protein